MKKQVKAFWLSLLSVVWLILMATSCHKTPTPAPPEPDLPLATQEGKGTIGCYINGKPWWPKWYFVVGGTPFLEAVFNPLDGNRFYLQSVNKNKSDSLGSYMSPTCKTLKVGDNLIDTINQRLGGWSVFQDYNLKNNCTTFTIDTTKIRRLYITKLDSVQRIVSGKFEFRAYNNCGDVLIFDGGRFDTKF